MRSNRNSLITFKVSKTLVFIGAFDFLSSSCAVVSKVAMDLVVDLVSKLSTLDFIKRCSNTSFCTSISLGQTAASSVEVLDHINDTVSKLLALQLTERFL